MSTDCLERHSIGDYKIYVYKIYRTYYLFNIDNLNLLGYADSTKTNQYFF